MRLHNNYDDAHSIAKPKSKSKSQTWKAVTTRFLVRELIVEFDKRCPVDVQLPMNTSSHSCMAFLAFPYTTTTQHTATALST
jgi:hypothetical protein